jgi:hypothetical protein
MSDADLQTVEDIRRQVEQSLPPTLVETMRAAGLSLRLGSASGPIIPAISDAVSFVPSSSVMIDPDYADELAEREQLEEMVSYRGDVTGIDHTIFISPRARTRHAPRIKVAINPPDSLDPGARTSSITIHDGKVVAGEDVPTALLKQVQKFITLNRDVLLDYWDYRIPTNQLQERLQSIKQ